MSSRSKFQEMVEQRMAQFDDVLRKMEPLTRNYDYEPEDVKEMLLYMRSGIDKLDALFNSSGRRGGFRFRPPVTAETATPPSDQDLEIPEKPTQLTLRKVL